MNILSIHSNGHDTAVAFWLDGRLVMCLEAERLSRNRHETNVRAALEWMRSWLKHTDVDLVALSTPYDRELVGIEVDTQILEGIQSGDSHFHTFCTVWGKRIPAIIVTHEYCHAALALHYSGYDHRTTLLVNEGRGSFSRNSAFYYDGFTLSLTVHDVLPWYGTGFGWSAIGFLLGLGKSPSVAGKVMAMGGFSPPSQEMMQVLQEVPSSVLNADFEARLSFGQDIRRRCNIGHDFDKWARLVGSFQQLYTDAFSEFARKRLRVDRTERLGIGGGCGLNIVANTAMRHSLANPIAISPACNDAGQAVGAGLYVMKFVLGITPEPFSVYSNGEGLNEVDASRHMKLSGLAVSTCTPRRVAELLARGKVIAFANGRSEFGPRALGARSLLANPAIRGMKTRVSEQIKSREWYRPLAPIMTQETFQGYFPLEDPSPHMLYNYPASRLGASEAVHVDGTARIQTLERHTSPFLYEVIDEFRELTGVPALINTSLNAGGKPIALNVTDILNDFLVSDVDAFFIEGMLGERS